VAYAELIRFDPAHDQPKGVQPEGYVKGNPYDTYQFFLFGSQIDDMKEKQKEV
jgi:hypothetical protein